MGDACDSPLGRNLHPPIDRILLKSLSKSTLGSSRNRESWDSIKWTQLKELDYYRLIGQLREAIGEAPFWTIEEYWEPSETVDD